MKLSALLLATASTILMSAVVAEPTVTATTDAHSEDRPVFAADADTKSPSHPTAKQKNKVNLDKVDINTQELILQALTLVGVNYRYGGKTPETGRSCV